MACVENVNKLAITTCKHEAATPGQLGVGPTHKTLKLLVLALQFRNALEQLLNLHLGEDAHVRAVHEREGLGGHAGAQVGFNSRGGSGFEARFIRPCIEPLFWPLFPFGSFPKPSGTLQACGEAL
jgi:hypothetical protein